MSCKVLPPGETPSDSPLSLRQVARSGSASVEMPPAASERIALMERECARRILEAQSAAHREGEAAGRRQASTELRQVFERLARSIEDLAGLRARLRHDAEADLVELALAIGRRVLRREMAVDSEALRGLVVAALEKLEKCEINRVRTHPAHTSLLNACLKEAGAGGVEIIDDPARDPGHVVFETERGSLDASVETQLAEIERGLADRLRRRA